MPAIPLNTQLAAERRDPWAGKSAREVSRVPPTVVSTPVIPPEQWFPLIKAAWTYVHTFAPDILRAQRRYQGLLSTASAATPGRDARLDQWLADRTSPIPVRTSPEGPGEVNWNLLTLMLGWKTSCASTIFGTRRAAGRRRRAQIEQAVADGHPATTGVIADLALIRRSDGTDTPGTRDSPRSRSAWNCACSATPATRWSWACR